MLKFTLSFLVCVLFLFCFVESSTYQNPVWNEDFADPFVLRVDSTYYAYSTNSGSYNIPTLVSDNNSLSNWKFVV